MDGNVDDRILRSNRIIAALVVVFLVMAWWILYLSPESSGARFAWEIRPDIMAAYMGAGYLGGAWFFLRVASGRRWHTVSSGFLPVAVFTIFMLLATALHWDRFSFSHLPFLLWLTLYGVTPFLVPWMWWRNRRADTGPRSAGDRNVPTGIRWSLGLLGAFLFGFALVGFLVPQVLIKVWVWQLSPLTARVLSGWFGLLGAGGLVISREMRWGAWRTGIQSIWTWHVLVLFGAALHAQDLSAGLLNWYLVSVLAGVVGLTLVYAGMELTGRKRPFGGAAV